MLFKSFPFLFNETTFKKVSEMICKISAFTSSHEGEDFMSEENEIKSTLYDNHLRIDVSLCKGCSNLLSYSSITEICKLRELADFNKIKDVPAKRIVALFTQRSKHSYFPILTNDAVLKIKSKSSKLKLETKT